MYDKEQANKVLQELRKAKNDVTRLSAEYRKVCGCNDFINGTRPPISKEYNYNKIYKTCEYHQVRAYHHANV